MSLSPVIFANGTSFFEELGKKFITHDKGLFIMSPSGAGKTHFYKQQSELHWIDGDDLWRDANAQPPVEDAWWDGGVSVIEQVEQRSDIITSQAVEQGFWILGSVNFWYKPHAIVIPPWEVLMERIKKRQGGDYDGGLTDKHLDQLITHIGIINQWHIKHDVPRFESIDEAVKALTA